MKPLGARVDALTLAYRVRFDPLFVQSLRARAEVAKEHGAAAFEWKIEEPTSVVNGPRRLGPERIRWTNSEDAVRRRSALWGEMRYTQQRGVWRVKNEPYFRFQAQEHAPGGGAMRKCQACRGLGMFAEREECPICKGVGSWEEPGWTFEIVWYAQELAQIGLKTALEESHAIAALTGDVLESRLRRIDLCVDIEGWEVSADDVKKIAKRPRARWAVDDVGPQKEPKVPRCMKTKTCKHRCTCGDMQVYGTGSVLAERRITGISVGRGGALMARIYDKRAELENDRIGFRRELEERRWRDAGWKGEAKISRVEFQIRGVALTELGVRDPDACVVPVYKHEWKEDANGKRKLRAVVCGEEVLLAQNDNGEEVQATIVHRLEAIWRTCLDWVRLVKPEVTKSGKPVPVSRLKDDDRWSLLRTVRFLKSNDGPIRRYRPRSPASAAQSLGVALAQSARIGALHKLHEGAEHYDDDEETEARLRGQLKALFSQTADHVLEWLLDKYGGPVGAAVHFAVKNNASRAKNHEGLELSWEPLAAVS